VNIKILVCQIIGPAAAVSAGPVPTPVLCHSCSTAHNNGDLKGRHIILSEGSNCIFNQMQKICISQGTVATFSGIVNMFKIIYVKSLQIVLTKNSQTEIKMTFMTDSKKS